MYLHGTSAVNERGNLTIGGMDTTELVKQYGTPLYVYDVSLIRQKARGFVDTFAKHGMKAQVAYASKAFCTVAMLQVVEEEGLSLDVVSGGELYTALQANFPTERIHFHGNNKSREELEMALRANIGCIVVDNFYELELLKELTEQYEQRMPILLRVTPGVEAHTHEYILTGQEDSKFGFDLQSGGATEAVRRALEAPYLSLLGVHFHIGSQIFDMTSFHLAAEKVFQCLVQWRDEFEFISTVLNFGGGFGIRYTDEDIPASPAVCVEHIISVAKHFTHIHGMVLPEIWIEPGRALAGDAGTTLYKVGSTKYIPNVRNYVSVDGGMSDNIRTALYDAKYEAALANRMKEEKTELVSVAGKCCETGDMLIWDVTLPSPKAEDILAISCTGAYCYSMASNYNRLPRPAVVFVENEEAQVVVERETYEDIIKFDKAYKSVVRNNER
ncbi:diaminopimelate decarboxylase [Priestia taiwanensis]|uniref:Diaminopimelate decarboxylase n=1 Tax=Priestia taiwanensis TaxID=1347902 RepID=A0A917AI27_9BACI|nr:diaminopimelate decarboxylase [Priestia taiwanensis]MBM7361488.1 diaminopimelate decarboxylase [Priestia taiwanensis]GGE54583.1 diaminopimelate decarboxylase [Priestia taiwanensis]